MPTFRIVAKYQPVIDNARSSRLIDLFGSYGVEPKRDGNPDGTGNIIEAIVHDHGRALHIRDALINLGMEVETTQLAS